MSNAISSTNLTHLYREAGRPHDLFPVFEQTDSFKPWIVVLAVIPTLFAFQHAILSETDSEWIMRSLDLLRAESVEGMVSPGGRDSMAEIKSQPPLGTWLSAAFIHLIPGSASYEALLVSWLGTALLIALSFGVVRNLLGGRVALWAVLLAACQVMILAQAQTVLPTALTLLTGLLSVRAFDRHLKQERAVITWPILGGGLALGACLMLGGPAALLFAMLQLVQCLVTIWYDRSENESSVSIVEPGRRLLALVLLWSTCFAAAGWWPLMMSSAYGFNFWADWISGIATSGAPLSEITDGWTFIEAIGPMVGLASYGMIAAIRQAPHRESRSERVLCLWLIVSCAGWIGGRVLVGPHSLFTQVSLLMSVFTIVVAAAVAFNQVTTGRFRVTWAVVWTVLPMGLLYGRSLQAADALGPLLLSASGFVIVLLLVLLGLCLLNRHDFSPRTWPRLFAAVFLVLLIFAQIESGFARTSSLVAESTTAPLRGDDVIELQNLLDELPSGIQQAILIAEREDTSRFRLQLVLKYPDHPVIVLKNWEELMDRLSDTPDRLVTLVLEWQDLTGRKPNLVSDRWILQYLGRPSELSGTDLRLFKFIPRSAPL
jgi:4-amino-4-deoxy-L-arabinose transferase-like glycosyltransferase